MSGAKQEKLSERQQGALNAMARLAADGTDVPTIREIVPLTGQTPDGAAYTLRSLVGRDLVEYGFHGGGRHGYKLTEAGAAQAAQPAEGSAR